MQTTVRPLRVLIVTPFGPGGRGGMDRLSDAIAVGVRERTDDIEVRTLTTYGQGAKALMPFHFARSLFELTTLRARSQVDLLHINVAGGGSAYRKAIHALWATLLGIPYIVHLHGSRFRETWPSKAPLLNPLLNALFANSEQILVLGKIWADYIRAGLPAVAPKICILPNATRARPAAPKSSAPNSAVHIVFMGLLGERKGSPLLIEALGRLATDVAWKATIAGNGDVDGHRQAAVRCGVADRITLTGWLGPAGVDDLLGAADLLVLPSFAENLPMVIIEAFAQGVPVVVTPVGAIGEVVEDGVTGLITRVGDVDALAAAIRTLVESAPLRQRMGAAARLVHAERFEMTGYLDRLMHIWRRAAVRASR